VAPEVSTRRVYADGAAPTRGERMGDTLGGCFSALVPARRVVLLFVVALVSWLVPLRLADFATRAVVRRLKRCQRDHAGPHLPPACSSAGAPAAEQGRLTDPSRPCLRWTEWVAGHPEPVVRYAPGMGEVARIVLAILGAATLVGIGVVVLRHGRHRIEEVDLAWGRFAQARGLEFAPHQGWYWFDYSSGSSPQLRGVVEGVPFSVELAVASRDVDSTQVVAPLRAGTLAGEPMTRIRPEHLTGQAARAWAALGQLRPDVNMVVWDAGGPAVAIGWRGLERNPAVLDAAIHLAAQLGRPPLAG